MITVTTCFNLFAATFALVAAYFWHRSATMQIPYRNEVGLDKIQPASIITSDNTDFLNTDEARSIQSKRGVYAAAIASFFQFVALVLQSVASSS